MNIFVCVVCAVLMVLGGAELVRLVAFWWTKPLTCGRVSLVIVPESGESCECAVRAAAERLHWLDWQGNCALLCVNSRDDGEIDSVCRFLKLRYPCLRVCKQSEIEYNILAEK